MLAAPEHPPHIIATFMLQSGTSIGPYQIIAKLGEGGMGEVYRAHDGRLRRDVALKILHAEVAADPARLDRFTQEARTVAALNHPHIVTIYSTEDTGGVRFLTMELVEGQSLDQLIPREGVPLARFLELAAPIADALTAAHHMQIAHRDLKPANVMVTSSGRVKVLDFGLARVLEGTRDAGMDATRAALTGDGIVVGTMPYMSPEQIEGRAIDHRTDLFSLGVMFYEMLAGARPFQGDSAPMLMASILRDPHPDLSAHRPDLPAAVVNLISRCLEKRPEHRIATARAVYDELRHAQRQLDSAQQQPAERATRPDAAASIVVLPFANRSPDPENEYFSDGLTEEVIADLSKVSALRVISKTTAMRLKQSDQDLAAIAARLNVRYALEGSVRKVGNNLRITAQLVDTRTDSTLWSDKFSGTIDNVFEIQEQVSRAIVEALQVRRDIWSFVPERLERAEAELQRALSVAGDQVLLYAALGMLHWQYLNGGISNDRRHLDQATSYARKIIELDPASASGPQLLGMLAGQRGSTVDMVRHLTRAVEIDPHDPYSRVWLALGWTFAGCPERARPLFKTLQATDPLFDYLLFGLGLDAYFAGDFGEAERRHEKARQLSPDHPGVPLVMVQALASAGEHQRMIRWMDEFAPAPLAHPLSALAHILTHAVLGEAEAADALISDDLEAKLWSDLQYTHAMAQAQTLLGRPDEAMRWLRQSVARGFLVHHFLSEGDPLLAGLRDLDSFAVLLGEVQHAAADVKAQVDGVA
jgi:serine/threonine protein kinase